MPTTITASRTIDAPVARVFDTVAYIDQFSQAVPGITDVELLSDQHRGVGTRFRETRAMKKGEATTELEVIEYVENERVRLIADEGGTIWDTVFVVQPSGDRSVLSMAMSARPHTLAARLLTPLIRGVVAKAVEADMDAVKAYCEAP